MRIPRMAVWHCSADEEGVDHPLSYYDALHRKRGFRKIGYHIVVHPNGSVEFGRRWREVGAHAKGYNRISVGIMYVGGIQKGTKTKANPNGIPKDTRTPAQKHSMMFIRIMLDYIFRDAGGIQHVGHRDLSVDLNGDGVISKYEWMKSCPCFDVETEFYV